MLFKDITVTDENFSIREHMYVGVANDRIEYVSDKPPAEDFGEVYDGKNKLLIPSFCDAHSHIPMCLMRGWGENLPLYEWLTKRIFPFEAHLTGDDIYYATLMGITEMFRYGIGSATEMYLNQYPEARAIAESGLKANLSACCICPDGDDYYSLPHYTETLRTIKDFDRYGNGRLRVEFSLHAEYTSNEKIARGIANAARENGSSMHIHVSETANEVKECRERHNGKSPVKYLADCGIFDLPTVAAHCIHIDENDIAILKQYNVTVATCPKGNAKLASGICPVTKLLKAGVNVAVGTDSVASNNNLNMIEEMRFFNLLQKAANFDPTVITPAETLYAATRAGALAQQRNDCGLIKEGFKADITVLDIDKPYMKPVHDLLGNLIYSASGNDVVLTMVDGRVCYRDGEYPTLDTERIYYEFNKSCNRLVSEFNG